MIHADGSSGTEEMEVLREHELTVLINDKPVMRLICTRDHLKELVTGRLYTDRMINAPDEIASLFFCRYENEAMVFLEPDIMLNEAVREDKSCCTGNRVYYTADSRREMKKPAGLQWKPEWIFSMAERFKTETGLHRRTQGTHSCLLARAGEIIFECEDIGRHNAIDKVVGYGLLNAIPLSECMIYTSGRVPVDMAEKVISAGIPVLASKSVPTAEAAALAHEYGLTLICRAHTDSLTMVNNSYT